MENANSGTSGAPETWRPVRDYLGMYEVSDQGRVRSLPRIAGRVKPRPVRGRVLRPGSMKHGRRFVNLCRDNVIESHRVAILVLEAFVSPRPEGMVGCHDNGDASDDRVSNLRWDSQSQNCKDKRQHGTDHELNRPTCYRGHEMAGLNLEPARLRRGVRKCHACNLARHALGTTTHPNFQRVADEYYRRVLRGEYAAGNCRRGHAVSGRNAQVVNSTSGRVGCRSCREAVRRAYAHYKRTGERWPEAQIRDAADAFFAALTGDDESSGGAIAG